MNDSLPPEGPGNEALPLVPLSRSPPLDRRQRAMALSQLSLQSLASNHYDAVDAEDVDETVGMATVFDWKIFDRKRRSNDLKLKNIRKYSENYENLLIFSVACKLGKKYLSKSCSSFYFFPFFFLRLTK